MSLLRVAAQAMPDPNRSVLDPSTRRARSGLTAPPGRFQLGSVAQFDQGSSQPSCILAGTTGLPATCRAAARLWPATVRFVGELGAQSVPGQADFMRPERWPELDWDDLSHHHGMQKGVFDRRLPPRRYPSFETWSEGSQAYQASLVRGQVEAFRRLRWRPTGGFACSIT